MPETDIDKKMAEIEDRRLEANAKQTAQQAGLQYINLGTFPIDNSALFLIDEADARKAHVAAISKNGSLITIAVLDPANPHLQSILQNFTQRGLSTNVVVTSLHGLNLALERYKLKKKTSKDARGVMSISEEEILNLQNQIQSMKDLQERI